MENWQSGQIKVRVKAVANAKSFEGPDQAGYGERVWTEYHVPEFEVDPVRWADCRRQLRPEVCAIGGKTGPGRLERSSEPHDEASLSQRERQCRSASDSASEMPNDSVQFTPRVDYMAESRPAQIRIRAETKTLMLNICVRQNILQNVVLELVRCAAALLILMFCAIASSSLCAQDQKLSEQPITAQPVEPQSPSRTPTAENFSGR